MRRHAKASFAGSTLGSGIRRGRLGLICLCVLGLAAFLGSSAPSAGAQACPNEAFRQGASAFLPDCRAYEMVSPVDMEGQKLFRFAVGPAPAPTASPDGESVAYGVSGAFGETVSNGISNTYIARRLGADWSSQNLSPPIAPSTSIAVAAGVGFTAGLDKWVFEGATEPPLVPGASESSPNLYRRDNASGSFQLVSVGLPAGIIGAELWQTTTAGISEDAGHVVFSSVEELTGCGGPTTERLCDWNATTGTLSKVGVKPGGEISTGAVTLVARNWRRPVSADGSRIFFHEAGGGECGTCVRVNGASTQIVSETGAFEVASSDGSLAYVTEGEDLKRYNVNTEELSPPIAGEVQGVLGASADGSRVYFVSKEELGGGTPGENNLYLWSEGAGSEFIATGSTSSVFTKNWSTGNSIATRPRSRITPDGMHLSFQADNSLTGFPDNGKSQAYLYSAATGELVCGSCVVPEPEKGSFILGGTEFPVGRLPRNLSDDGSRLFFSTTEALAPRDVNGQEDVYEYDAASGEVGLISSGAASDCALLACEAGTVFSATNEYFGDASASGDDAFFLTTSQLVPVDQDEVLDAYDARVNGGFASQNPSPASPCTGDACRGQSSSPDLAAPASAGFVGKGNVSQKQNCNKLGREAKKLSQRAKRLRKNAKQAKRNGKSALAKKRNKKATRLAKRARNKSKSAKRCRKVNRGASK